MYYARVVELEAYGLRVGTPERQQVGGVNLLRD